MRESRDKRYEGSSLKLTLIAKLSLVARSVKKLKKRNGYIGGRRRKVSKVKIVVLYCAYSVITRRVTTVPYAPFRLLFPLSLSRIKKRERSLLGRALHEIRTFDKNPPSHSWCGTVRTRWLYVGVVVLVVFCLICVISEFEIAGKRRRMFFLPSFFL